MSLSVFVGYWPDQDTVVVAHEGTDPTQLYAFAISRKKDQVKRSPACPI
jgi:hypothetical protein